MQIELSNRGLAIIRISFFLLHHLLIKDLFIVKSLRMIRSLVKFSGLVKAVTKMVTGCLRAMIVAIFALGV